MRLPYIPNPPNLSNPTDQAVATRIQQRRGATGLLPLDLALLHSPPVADGWNSFLGALRSKTTIADSITEIAACRVAVLNQAWFEWEQHSPLLRACPGVTEEFIQYVREAPPRRGEEVVRGGVLDERHEAVLAYTDAMTLSVKVPDSVFGELKKFFGEREIVEITAVVAAYNCVSRFLVALDVGEMNR